MGGSAGGSVRGLTLGQWTALYGVRLTRERTGFCRWDARLTFGRRTLERRNLLIPFGPSLREALEPLVRQARRAEAVGGSFYAYLETRAPGRALEDYREEFSPLLGASDLLRRWAGDEAAERLIWGVRWG